MHFGIEKSRDEACRDVSRLSDSTARHARHVHLSFSRSYSWDWCKSRTQKT